MHRLIGRTKRGCAGKNGGTSEQQQAKWDRTAVSQFKRNHGDLEKKRRQNKDQSFAKEEGIEECKP